MGLLRRFLIWALGFVLLVPTTVLLLVVLGLQTEAGRGLLAEGVARASSEAGAPVLIGRIEGRVPFDMTARDISVADPDGIWFEAEALQVVWDPMTLLAGRARLEAVSLIRGKVHRAPQPPEDVQPPPPPSPVRLPPIPAIVDRLIVDGLEISADLAGDPLTIDGRFHARTAGSRITADGSVTAATADGQIGSADLETVLDVAEDTLSVSVVAAADRNSAVLEQMIPVTLPGDILVRLKGDGPVDGWRGRLDASAGDGVGLAGDIVLTRPSGVDLRISLDGAAEVRGLLTDPAFQERAEVIPVRVVTSVAESGDVSLEAFQITGYGAQVSASGLLKPVQQTASMDATLEIWDGERLPVPMSLPRIGGGSVTLTARLDGDTFEAEVNAALREGSFARPEIGVRARSLEAHAEVSGAVHALIGDGPESAAIEASLSVGGIVPLEDTPEPVGAAFETVERIEASLSGSVSRKGRLVIVDRIGVDTNVVSLEGQATATDFAWVELSGSASAPDLSVLEPIIGRAIGGAAAVSADATVGLSPFDVAGFLEAEIQEPALGEPDIDPLLGRIVTVDTAIAAGPDGAIVLDALSVEADLATARGRLSLTAAGAIDGRLTANVPDLSPLTRMAGRSVSGAVETSIDLGGSIDAPAIQVDWKAPGLSIAEVPPLSVVGGSADLLLALAEDRISGDVSAAAQIDGAPASLAASVAIADAGDRLEIRDLLLEGPATRLTGSLNVRPAVQRIDGEVSGDIEDLSALAALSPGDTPEIGGSASIRAVFSSTSGQTGDVSVVARGISVGAVSVEAAEVNGRVEDLFGSRLGRIDGAISGIVAETARIDSTVLAALVDGDAVSASLRLGGSVAVPDGDPLGVTVTGDARGTLSEAGADVVLERFDATIADRRLGLVSPAMIGVAKEGGFLKGLAIAVGESRILADASLTREDLSGQVTVTALPVDIARVVAPSLGLDGRIDVSATVAGSLADPSINVDGTVTNLSPVPPLPGAPTARLSFEASVEDHAVSASLTGAAPSVGTLSASMSTRLTVQVDGPPVLLPDADLAGEATGRIDLALIPAILDLGEDRVVGTLDVDLAFAGTVDAPTASGSVSLSDGRLENDALGTIVDEISLRLVGDGNRLTLEAFSATDGEEGTLSGRGSVRLDPVANFPFRFEVEADGFTAVRRDEATVAVAMDTNLEGNSKGATLGGTVTVEEAEIFIAAPPPADVVLVEIEEVGVPRNRPLDRPKEPPKPSPILLDMTIDIPGRAFVRGRGVDSEWRGNLKVDGDANQPLVSGSIEVVRGEFKAVGRTFTFEEGLVGLNGDPDIDPSVAIQLTTELSDLDVDIKVSGTAKAPVIDVVSSPSLPEDETLARILFGQSVAELSPLQALQLARSAAILSGELDGPGALDGVRDQLGFDTIDVTGGGQGGLEAAGLSVGKYIAPGVFLQLVQGFSTGSSKAVVEVELTDSVTVESDLGADSQGRVGVNLKLDY